MSVSPSALTASELEVQVRELVGDYITFETAAPDSIDPQTWSTQQIYDSLNFAIKQYCKATHASFRQLPSDLDSDGVAMIPTSYLDVEHVIFPSKATNAKAKYIRIAEPAAAWTSDEIYIARGDGIWCWDANTGYEFFWSKFPSVDSGYTFINIDISSTDVFVHYNHVIVRDAVIYARAVYKRPLDGSSGWSLVVDFGWEDWAGVNGWWTTRIHKSMAFAGGAVYLTTMGQTDYVSSPLVSWRSQIVPGESNISYSALRVDRPLYYASADRTLLGGMSINARSIATSDAQRGGNAFDATASGGYTLDFGGQHWIYKSDVVGIHAMKAIWGGNALTGYSWSYEDHVYPGAALSSVPPVPFADRSLLILDDGSGLWWDGTMFTRDALGTSSSILEHARYRKASWTASAGVATTLLDGSVMHVCETYSNGFGVFGTFGDE